MNYTVIEELSDKHNRTTLIRLRDGKKAVLKRFKDAKGADIEASVLEKISVSGYAPHVLEHGEGYLINEYIEGVTLYEQYRILTMTDDKAGLGELADMLAIYLQIFYSLNDSAVLKDINFKNFIIRNGRCYGIDYDKIGEGMQYTDIAGVIANAAIATVGETYCCLPFVERMLKNFHLELFDVINEVRVYLEQYSEEGQMLDIDNILNSLLAIDDCKIDVLTDNNGR